MPDPFAGKGLSASRNRRLPDVEAKRQREILEEARRQHNIARIRAIAERKSGESK